VSTDTEEAVKPATFREFDQAGSFLIGGFQNKTPRKWIRIDPVSGEISISTPNANVLVECRESGDITIRTNGGNVTVHATGTATIDAPQTHVTGDMRVDGMLTVDKNLSVQGGGGGGSSFTGGFSNTGGAITSNGVTLETHTHPGDSGGTTGAPNA
jgi:phage baseplate assembly protein gpV